MMFGRIRPGGALRGSLAMVSGPDCAGTTAASMPAKASARRVSFELRVVGVRFMRLSMVQAAAQLSIA